MKIDSKEVCPCKNLVIWFVDKIDRRVKLGPYGILVKSSCITGSLQITCPLCGWRYALR